MTAPRRRTGRIDGRRKLGRRPRATATKRRPARRTSQRRKPATGRFAKWLATGLLAIVAGSGLGYWSMLMHRPPPAFHAEERKPVPVAAAEPKRQAKVAADDMQPPADILDLLPAAGRPVADEDLAWRRNAVAVADPGNRPMIAVVIDDLGLARANADRVVALPGPLTLSFMSYAPDVALQAKRARAAGHELLVHVPMQPEDERLSAGSHVLQVDLAPDELSRRIEWALSRFDGYVGINNHMGSRFTADAAGMSVLFEELHRRGLLFLDSRTTAATVADALAAQYDVPFARRNVFLDDEQSSGAVWAQLAEVEKEARHVGMAVAIGHPHDATIAALSQWLPTLAGRGFALVPISRIVREAQDDRDLAAAH